MSPPTAFRLTDGSGAVKSHTIARPSRAPVAKRMERMAAPSKFRSLVSTVSRFA